MTALLTFLTLLAFAGNSVLCRMALESGEIDPVSFTGLRLISGAVVLLCVSALFSEKKEAVTKGTWKAGVALFIYALFFSVAYLSLGSGMGALLLFSAVQFTMLTVAFLRGERMNGVQWTGVLLAVVGLIYLVSPGLSAPDLKSSLLMIKAGVAWGVYTIEGKSSATPVLMTRNNFLRASGLTLLVGAAWYSQLEISRKALLIAVLSGGVTSGLAYALWYRVLPRLSTTQAAVLQLLVPVIAALGGALLLRESLSLRIILSSLMILGGVLCVILRKEERARADREVLS